MPGKKKAPEKKGLNKRMMEHERQEDKALKKMQQENKRLERKGKK